jgi:hypothetical protein|tara:strand:+ start:160 stop:720 length:561 start_codon:yes stop_codon:yes gene_type:complete
MLEVKVYSNGIRVKVIELKNIRYFFRGMSVLADKWKIKPFIKIRQIKDPDLTQAAYDILIGLIYKYMCAKRGWEVNEKRFKNQMLLKNKSAFIFDMQGEFQEVEEKHFNEAMRLLKEYDLIKTGSHSSYIKLNNTHLDYCCKLGNYLFDTKYAQESIKDNTHYFGDHSSLDHERAYREKREISVLN